MFLIKDLSKMATIVKSDAIGHRFGPWIDHWTFVGICEQAFVLDESTQRLGTFSCVKRDLVSCAGTPGWVLSSSIWARVFCKLGSGKTMLSGCTGLSGSGARGGGKKRPSPAPRRTGEESAGAGDPAGGTACATAGVATAGPAIAPRTVCCTSSTFSFRFVRILKKHRVLKWLL